MEDLDQAAEQVFGEALDLEGDERRTLLDRACRGQPALRSKVESLLDENDRVRGFLSEPAIARAEETISGNSNDGLPHEGLPDGTRLGRYSIIERLGEGGMGDVYVALDPALERRVAIKLLPAAVTSDKSRVRRFTHEAKAASALNHPNIVTIYGFGECEFGQYLVMELIAGQRLRSLEPKPLDPSVVTAIGAQIARALEATHASGIIHRDLKPDNIMVRPDGLVKVVDFGIARLARSIPNSTEPTPTLPGTTLGTPEYMSPEQVRGEWLTSASDVFSLGIVLYELATGKHPFEADSRVAFMHSILSRQVVRPSRLNPSIPPWFESLLIRMLDKDPQTRCAAADIVRAFSEKELEHASTVPFSPTPSRRIVGRRKELAELNAALQGATHGRSMMLCISGEAGQGKTTLIDEFLQDVSGRSKAFVAVGRCFERLANAGAYLPVLEMLEGLLTGVDRESTHAIIKSIAPTWYGQLVSTADPTPSSPSQERLKREFLMLLQELSARQPLLVFLDDVHWADVSTTDLLFYIGRQMDQLRLLLLTTFRPAELYSANHPFLQLHREMQMRQISREIQLEFFSATDIREYLDLRFPGHSFPDELAQKLAQRTEGNPLFVADLLRYMQEQDAIVIHDGCWTLTEPLPSLDGMPDTVRGMVQRTMEQLGEEERRLLAAASVQGNDFESAVLAHAMTLDAVELEDKLEKLERKSSILRLIDEHELPDRTLTLRYRFVHVLYHDHLYESVRPARRMLLSKAIGKALQHFYGAQSGKIAAQLATLLDVAREFESSAAYYQSAAQNALRLFAGAEAEALAQRGLVAAQGIAGAPDRRRLELALHASLALALRNQKTHASSEALESHRRVDELSQECGDEMGTFFAHVGMFWSALSACDFEGAQERANECLRIAERMGDPSVLMQAQFLIGYSCFLHAEHVKADRNLRDSIALYDLARDAALVETFGLDIRANGLAFLAMNCWYRGFPSEAQTLMREAVEFARATQNPMPLSVVLVSHAMLCELLDDPREMMAASQEVIEVANKHGLQKNTLFWGKFANGWSMTRLGKPNTGWALIREAIVEAETIHMSLALPLLSFGLASALLEHGLTEEAAAVIEQSLSQAERCGPRDRLSEIYRVKGEILLRRGAAEEGEEHLVRALNTARRFGQRSIELRAAMSLGSLYHQQGRTEAARSLLSHVYSAFTEGFETRDLQKAKALMDRFGEVNANVPSV